MSDSTDKPESTVLRRGLAIVAGKLIIGAAGLLTGVRAIWSGTTPKAEQTLYFANHTSHGDFVLLWTTGWPRSCGSSSASTCSTR